MCQIIIYCSHFLHVDWDKNQSIIQLFKAIILPYYVIKGIHDLYYDLCYIALHGIISYFITALFYWVWCEMSWLSPACDWARVNLIQHTIWLQKSHQCRMKTIVFGLCLWYGNVFSSSITVMLKVCSCAKLRLKKLSSFKR